MLSEQRSRCCRGSKHPHISLVFTEGWFFLCLFAIPVLLVSAQATRILPEAEVYLPPDDFKSRRTVFNPLHVIHFQQRKTHKF